MADPVNLRQFRKRKQRADKEREAGRNRAIHGRTLEERKLVRAIDEVERRRHEAGRIEKDVSSADDKGTK